MKANELRIGNYVNTMWHHNDCPGPKIFWAPITIGSIGSTYVTTDTFQTIFFYDDDEKTKERIKPIPLTEEWLLKFGFKKMVWPSGSIEFQKDIPDFTLEFWFENEKLRESKLNCGCDDFRDIDLTDKCKYVHQLQNLCQSLTGEELTLAQNGTK